MSTSVRISQRPGATGVRIRQILTHQSSPGEWVAVPSERELGTRQTALNNVAKGLQELEKEPEGASKVARDTERIKRARHEERARDMRIEDPDQRPDRRAIEGTGASSSRDGSVVHLLFLAA